MSSHKKKKIMTPRFAASLARYQRDMEKFSHSNVNHEGMISEDITRFDEHPMLDEDSASSSMSQQPTLLEIPNTPEKPSRVRFNIKEVMRNNVANDTRVANDSSDDEDSDMNMDEAALERLGEQEKNGRLLEVDDGDLDNDDEDPLVMPHESRIEEMIELFGDKLEEELGENFKEQIAAMFENGQASDLYALVRRVTGEELLQGIDTAARPDYDLDDPMIVDSANDILGSDADDEDSIEEVTRKRIADATTLLKGDVSNEAAQDDFERTVHGTLDRKEAMLEDRGSVNDAWICDIANNPLGKNIEDVISALTITDIEARVARDYSYMRPLFNDPENADAFRRTYQHCVALAALHLRSFTKPETRSTLALGWSLFYGSTNAEKSPAKGRQKNARIPTPQELGFEPKNDQIAIATSIATHIQDLETAVNHFTGGLSEQLESHSPSEPGVEFFRALKAADHNISLRFVPSWESGQQKNIRCAISGDILAEGDSVYICRVLGLRAADQTLIPLTFRGSASWQNQKYRDIFRIFYIKQHITAHPPQIIHVEKSQLTGMGLSRWEAPGDSEPLYIRYSAILEKLLSFWGKIYAKDPMPVIVNIAKLTKKPSEFARLLLSFDATSIQNETTLNQLLDQLASAIGNQNQDVARDILGACFCRMANVEKRAIVDPPGYMHMDAHNTPPVISLGAIVKTTRVSGRFVSIFCATQQTADHYEKLLEVAKRFTGVKEALPGLLVAAKIMDVLISHRPTF